MTPLQEKELALLKEFIKVCSALELRYYLVCGSALGAVKYSGFIPWDDDIDIAMPREDYDKFISQAKSFLPSHVFIQNSVSEPQFPTIYTKLRDSSTTCIEKSACKLNINHGIAIDIFPLDGYPVGKVSQRFFEARKFIYKKLLASAYCHESFIKNLIYTLIRFFGGKNYILNTVKSYNRLITAYPLNVSSLWANHGNWQGKLDYTEVEYFGKGKAAFFEGIEVIIPENAHEYLTKKYGNYRDDPPQEKRQSHHIHHIVDTERPYTYYLTFKGGNDDKDSSY